MAKIKSVFICRNCGAKSAKWIGKCNSCMEWNTYSEEVISTQTDRFKHVSLQQIAIPVKIAEICLDKISRMDIKSPEFNRVLGGGLIPGSVVLIGGEPGIGKSTLMLQTALKIKDKKVLYVSGEESLQQIRHRAERLNLSSENCFILNETSLDNIMVQIDHLTPDLIIIDSIQTLYFMEIDSSPGTVSQVRECTNILMKFAKSSGTPVILVGHINKDGNLAGPKVLEHIVDTVLQFEGDQNHQYRIIRTVKNRYGSTSELGLFRMNHTGLDEVTNPSELLLSSNTDEHSGSTVAATINGNRPFIIEIQALVSTAAFGTPQRSSNGFDLKRLNMLLAVLEKRAGFKIAFKDVFLNIAGGIKVDDPGVDLAVLVAVVSSGLNSYMNEKYCFAGEVGLSGEIRPVGRLEQRIAEAEKLGFRKFFVANTASVKSGFGEFKIEICTVSNIYVLIKKIFRDPKNITID